MTGVMLDIGAGSTDFVKRFRRLNRQYKLMYLCGEPNWKGVWSGEAVPRKIRKIQAKYDQFNVPQASLHFVTLNAYHPLMVPEGIEKELIRALIPLGGVFISAHPVGNHPNLATEFFYPIAFDGRAVFSHQMGFWQTTVCSMQIDRLPVLHYPASFTIRSRLRELLVPEELRDTRASYCYSRSNQRPSVKVWLRNEKPAS
jgi:hypothetical protein